jgi:type I restriction enzyme S subunit
MKATDAYRKINSSPIKGIVLYYTEQVLQMDKVPLNSVISQIQTGKTPPKANHKYYSSPDVNWFKPSDIGYEKYLVEADEKFSKIAVAEKKATIYPADTLLLIGIGGGVGRVSILKEEGSSNQQITGISFNEEVCSQYAYYYYLVREDYIKSQAKSMSFPILNQSKTKALEFKYPTINEQKEFVKFIDACWNSFLNNQIPDVSVFEISVELKEYALKQFKAIELEDIIQKNIENELTLLSNLKQSILQEVIQGKLTADWRAQNPNTEPASELLKRIKAEKEKLIKDKKIKKEKALPPITEEEIPFELPESWVWCRLGEIIVNADNLDIQKKLSPNELINYVDIDAIDNKKQVIREAKALPVRELSSRARRVLKRGQILYSLVRPYLHNLAIVEDEKPNYIGSTGFAVFDCLCVENKYVFWLLLSKYIEEMYLEYMDGFNSPSITHDQFKSTIIPVPPFAEQKAIVEKVETLTQKCQALEQEIKNSEANAQMLMQAVLKEAFEGKKEVYAE